MREPERVIDGAVNQSRELPDGTIVQRLNIVGVDMVAYEAWRRDMRTAHQFGDYSTITYRGDIRYGAVGSERLPADLDALPAFSDERMTRVMAWCDERVAERNRLILAAFPESLDAHETIYGYGLYRKGLADQARYDDWVVLHPAVKAEWSHVRARR